MLLCTIHFVLWNRVRHILNVQSCHKQTEIGVYLSSFFLTSHNCDLIDGAHHPYNKSLNRTGCSCNVHVLLILVAFDVIVTMLRQD
jgi:hypothetical protein